MSFIIFAQTQIRNRTKLSCISAPERQIKQFEPDPMKRGEISPDQVKVVARQVDNDTEKK
jgi:hypothetical protein